MSEHADRGVDRGSRRSPQRRARVRLACLLLGLAGCAVGPDFTRPAPPTVSAYLPPEPSPTPSPQGGTEAVQRVALGERIPAQWWGLFHSARLDEFLRQAIVASYTLAAARATLAQAREAIIEARAGLYPQVDLGANAHRGTSATGGVANLFSVGPTVSYSIDAFGGTRRHVEQEAALAENQWYQLAAAYLTLTGNSVVEAITAASTRLQIATVEDLIRNDQKNLDLTEREFNAGKVARADVLTAAAQLETDRTQLPALRQQLSAASHALTLLAARAPSSWSPPEFDIDEFTLPGKLPMSLPSELVHERPDILAAEALVHADSAAIGVATAQMYPSITLSASFMQAAPSASSLFNSVSQLWGIGAALDAPLYSGGALTAQRRAAIDTFDAGLATYQQTVLQAFAQVADALTALEHDSEMVAASRRAVDIAHASLKLQRSSYVAGKTSALQLIVAENTYSNARLGYARADGQRLTDTAQLFIAVGGGWWDSGDI